jgi:DNA anti-recombination protein RmuC
MSEDPAPQDADLEETTAARRKARRRRGSEANNGGGVQDGQEPDVLLDVSELEVDRIRLEVENLRAHVSVLAELANLVSLSVGADARLDRVKLEIEGVRAKVLLKVRLENVRAILEKALDTVAEHPEILESLGQTLDELLEGRLGDARDTLEQVLEGLEEADTVDALLKGRLEDVRATLQDILESHGGGGTEREALSEGPGNDTGSSAPEQSSGDNSSS